MATQYRVSFDSDAHASMLVDEIGGEVVNGNAVGDEAFGETALDRGYIVEVLEDGEEIEARVSETSPMAGMAEQHADVVVV